MPSAAGKLRPDTVDDLLAIPEPERFHEIVDGELVRKGMPSFRHGRAPFEAVELSVHSLVAGDEDGDPEGEG